ncbi:MAG: hypothetical protein ABIP94_14780 [Planctomycetota bacterium]
MTVDPLTAELLTSGPFARDDAPFRLLELAGPDAAEFLHRLCTQEVLGLAEGQVVPAAFLDAKGKLQVTCLIGRLGSSWWIETHAEQEERLAALLERYHFTEKLTVQRRGEGPCHEVVMAAPPTASRTIASSDGVIALRWSRRGVSFVRRHGAGAAATTGAPLAPELAECLRMGAGLVRVGVDTEPSTLALEADLDDHCSTTKGCYTGQEIVARIHTYGHVNRKLCLLHLTAGEVIAVPVPLLELEDQLPVGRVMHAVPVPGRSKRVGLGYLPKDFQAIGTKLALSDGSAVEVVGFAPLAEQQG